MLLECSCGKMYRVRDGAVNPPKSCPACGGPLRASGGPSAAPPPPPPPPAPPVADPRAKELERELGAAKAAAELKDKELHEAQASIARLGADLEKAQAAYKEALKSREDRIQELEAESAKNKGAGAASAQTMQLLRAKDEALRQAEEKASSLEGELEDARKGSTHMAEELAAVESKYKEALRLKEREVEELQTQFQALEKGAVEAAASGGDPEKQRLAAKVASLEKIIQDGETRYRALQKQLEAAGPANEETSNALKERDERIAELQREMAELRNRPTSRRPLPAPAPVPAAAPPRNDKARYLAADLDKGIESISTALAGLAARVRRLNEALEGGVGTPAPVEDNVFAAEPVAEPPPAEPVEPADLPAIEAAPADEEAVPQLETFDAPAESPADNLPADETLLDMGGAKAKKEDEIREVPMEEAETPAPEPAPEASAEPEASRGPQKKGFFGKLFGKKK